MVINLISRKWCRIISIITQTRWNAGFFLPLPIDYKSRVDAHFPYTYKDKSSAIEHSVVSFAVTKKKDLESI